jgi:hypothetical protein
MITQNDASLPLWYYFPCLFFPLHYLNTPYLQPNSLTILFYFSFLCLFGPTECPISSALIPDLGLLPQGLSVPDSLQYWQIGPLQSPSSPFSLPILSVLITSLHCTYLAPLASVPDALPRSCGSEVLSSIWNGYIGSTSRSTKCLSSGAM